MPFVVCLRLHHRRQLSGGIHLTGQAERVHAKRPNRLAPQASMLGMRKCRCGSQVVAGDERRQAPHKKGRACAVIAARRNSRLDVVAAQHPQRQRAQRRLGQQPVQVLDLPQRPTALPEDAVQHALVIEVRQRRINHAFGPEAPNKGRGRKGLTRSGGIDDCLIHLGDGRIDAVSRIGQRRPAWNRPQPLRVVVDERRRVSGQLAQVR